MQRLQSVLAVLALALTTWLVVGDGLPNTFRECVVRGGDLGMIGADVTCRYVETSTLRTYVMGTTECGEEVSFDIWEETQRGVMTYAFQPDRTEVLSSRTDVGNPWEMPIPCLHDPGKDGD